MSYVATLKSHLYFPNAQRSDDVEKAFHQIFGFAFALCVTHTWECAGAQRRLKMAEGELWLR